MRLKESQIGSKFQMDYSVFYGSVFQSRVREHFMLIPDVRLLLADH